MATPNRKLRAGLATLGLFWTSATLAPGQEAVPPMPASMPAPAPPNAPTFAVLLLSNGRLLQGNVSETPAGDAFELRTKGGAFPVPKKDVRKRYGSMAELYEDKVAHLPDRDPDERMKLALWCLEQHMETQARDQLQAVLAINPGDRRAQRMVANIEANAQRATGRDPEVRAAGAEVVEPAPPGSAMGVPMPRTRSRVVEKPVIFDLPPDVAMKRFVEFAWDVHPILQASCASCHNEAYQGEYRLIGGKSRRDWTADVVRANLDATLRHVRRDDPSHSDLVAYAANPHGATPRPAFHGPNDRRYRLLVTWLQSLKATEAVTKAGYVPPAAPPAATPLVEGFGADRIPSPPGSSPTPTPMPSPGPSLPKGMAGQTYVESYQREAVAPGVPPGVRFDPPSLPGIPRPKAPPLQGTATPVQTPARPMAKPGTPPTADNLPALPPGTPVPPPDDVIPPTNRSKKSSKVDPALLEKLMRTRQQGQP